MIELHVEYRPVIQLPVSAGVAVIRPVSETAQLEYWLLWLAGILPVIPAHGRDIIPCDYLVTNVEQIVKKVERKLSDVIGQNGISCSTMFTYQIRQ